MLFNENKVYIFDGAKGTYLHEKGLKGSESAEMWNLTHADIIKTMYKEYVDAGAEVLQTNTFPGNETSFIAHGGTDCYKANFEGVRLAKEAIGDKGYVAGCVGPVNGFLEPSGTIKFEDCVKAFVTPFKAYEDAKADLANFSTFTDLAQLRCSIIAMKENTALPFIATLSLNGEHTLAGNTAECCAIVCEALGAELVGLNCGEHPEEMIAELKKMETVSNIALIAKPNAGLPEVIDGKPVYSLKPKDFAVYCDAFIDSNVKLLGTCCGSNAEHIAEIAKTIENKKTKEMTGDIKTFVCSAYEHTDALDYTLVDMSEFKNALAENDFDDIIDELMEADEASVTVLDFSKMDFDFDMWGLISSISVLVKQPLGVKTNNKQLLEKFVRYYCGKALVVSDKENQDVCNFYGALRIDD